MARDVRQTTYNMTKHRVGSTSHYTNFDSAGRQTMAGTARVRKTMWIPATDWYSIMDITNAFNAQLAATTGTTVACPVGLAYGDSGSNPQVPALSSGVACGKDARAATVFLAPLDADTSGSITMKLYYTTRLAMATAGSVQVFRVHRQQVGSAGSPEVGNSACVLTAAAMTGVGKGVMEIASLGSFVAFQRAASPLQFLELAIENSSTSSQAYISDGSSEEVILGLEIEYTACALGASSTE